MTLTVVKCGGAALAQGPFVLERYVEAGGGACVVHGAGGRITAALRSARVESQFVGGRRVTSSEALPIVREAFRQENELLCSQIGPTAFGLMGDDLGLEGDRLPGFGHVGMLRPVVPPSLWGLLAAGRVPVIAPLARGPLNVNADDAAAALALGLGARSLVFLTDVAGLYIDDEIVEAIGVGDARRMIAEGAFDGGIVPKLRAAALAAASGITATIGRTAVVA